MTENNNIIAQAGIRFFGSISASATHEIKNTLAIINESAGLLQDLSLMARQKGHSLCPERINDISQRMIRQVHRTDLVLKKMNRFSHSVDQAIEIADLEKTIIFVLDLTSRLVQRLGAFVEIISPVSPLMVSTNLFFLENMIWRAIETACRVAGNGKEVKISFGTDGSEPSIWFTMDTVKPEIMDDLFRSKEDLALISCLNISVSKNNKNTKFGLLWPKCI